MRKSIRLLFGGSQQSLVKLGQFFPANDFIVTPAASSDELISHLGTSSFDLVFLCVELDPPAPLHLLENILKNSPQMSVIVFDPSPSLEKAVQVMRSGAVDYIADEQADYPNLLDRIKSSFSKNFLRLQTQDSGRIIEIHAISQNSIDPFLAINQQGRVIEWNRPMEQITGYPEAQMIGVHFWDALVTLLPPDQQTQSIKDQLRSQIEQFFANDLSGWEKPGQEFEIHRPDGISLVVSLTVFPLLATQDPIAGCILHDVTGKRRAEEAFRASEERYRMLVNIIPDGIVVHTDGIIMLANQKAIELAHGSSLEDLLGKPLLDFVHPDYREFVLERIRLSGYEFPLPPVEEKFLRLDGTAFDAEVQTLPIHFKGRSANLVLLRDITERKQAEEMLRQSESRLNEAQRLAHLGSFEMTTDLQTSYWSEELYRIFEHPVEKGPFNFFTFMRHVHPEDRSILREFFKNTASMGAPFTGQFRYILDAGEVKYLDVIGQPILDESGKIKKIFGTIADITLQKMAELALRNSEARYHGLFENSPIVISEQDFSQVNRYLENLRSSGVTDLRAHMAEHPQVVAECVSLLKMIDINQAGLALYRAGSKQEILGNLTSLIKSESLELFAEELVQIFNGNRKFALEGVNYTLDGEPRQVMVRWIVSPEADLDTSNVVVTVTDITDRKHILDELVRSEDRFRSIIEQSLDGIVITDREGIIREWNHGMEVMTGLRREQAIGMYSWEFQYRQMLPENREKVTPEQVKKQVMDYLAQPRATFYGKVVEHPILRVGGDVRIIQSVYFPIQSGQEQMVVNISRDVTDYHEARRTLDQTQERFKLMMENISDLVVLFEPDGTITYASPSFRHTLQYEPEEMIGVNVFSVIHPEDVEIVRGVILPRLVAGEDMERVDYRAKRKDGTYIWLETGAQPIYGADGRVLQVVASSRDVTERKKTEHELQSAQIQLAHRIAELEMRTQELNLLTEMTNMLQICSDPHEAISVISQYASDLFPGVSGILYIESPEAEIMKGGAVWGNYYGDKEINRKDCWGLRRGRIHTAQDAQSGLYCHHTGFPQPSSSICIPVLASGQAVGLLSLQTAEEMPPLTTAQQKLAAATAEQIGLALSNLYLRQNLREMAIRDSLTGLYNRHFLEETLETEVNRAQRSGKSIGIIMLDLDHFKELNSTFGHPNVDQMLREFGAMLKRSIRSGDIACRYGGDEFLLILPETSLEVAQQRAEQIRVQVKTLRIHGENLEPRNASASIGVACWPQHGRTSLRLLNTVDLVLFKAKQAGGDRVMTAEV